jgi:chorismate synthase
MQYDQRLDAQFASALMSIPSVKGVEVGLGFDYSKMSGSTSHDEIFYNSKKGFYHKTNHSGGIEGGMSNGETVVLRMAVKPIATLMQPLNSVDIISKKVAKAAVVRSDTCAVLAAGVIAESMAAIVVTQAMLQKFGSDSLKEIQANYKNYLKGIK